MRISPKKRPCLAADIARNPSRSERLASGETQLADTPTITESVAAATASGEASPRPVVKFKPQGSQRRSIPAAKLQELNEEHQQLIELMVYGLETSGEVDGVPIEAGVPLTLEQAARSIGVRCRRARELHRESKLFQATLNQALKARRDAEGPRNLSTAIAIRDERGDNTAADRAVRLKAIASIEGRDGQGVNVNVQVNSQTNVAPGYVYKVPEHLARNSAAPVLDAQPVEPPE